MCTFLPLRWRAIGEVAKGGLIDRAKSRGGGRGWRRRRQALQAEALLDGGWD